MSKATLVHTGFMIVGPTVTLHCGVAAKNETTIEVLRRENLQHVENGAAPILLEDLVIREQFAKTYCGPVDFSEEALAGPVKTWDEEYEAQILSAIFSSDPSIVYQASTVNQALLPRPVIGVVQSYPNWYSEEQRAAIARVIEIPVGMHGFRTGYHGAGHDGRVLNGTEDVRIEVREVVDAPIARIIESIVLDARTTDKSKIGPFEIVFFEPNAAFNGVTDAWVLKAGYFHAPFCERPAQRDVQEKAQYTSYRFTLMGDEAGWQYGPEARERGEAVLKELNNSGANPHQPAGDPK